MYIFSNVIARFLTLIFAALYALGGAPWSTLAELPQMPYPAELPVQEAFAALEPSQYTITRTAAPGQPKKGKLGEYAFFLNYDAHEYRLTLDKYYDIQRVTIRFAPGKAHDFLVQFAESELVWYNAKPLSREQNGDTVTLTVDECYRKYIRVQLSGPAASKDDVLDMQVVAAPTVVLPTVRRGPVTMGVARPVILPLPADVPGVAQAVSDLSGTWKLSLDPPGGFWRSAAAEGWRDAQVPAFTEVAAGELLPSQANDIREVAYKTAFVVPEDARGKRLFLRFESVQTTARVWVNGVLAGTHHGGYGTFDFDITAYAQPGAAATLVVGVARVPYDASFTLSRGPDTMGINGPVKLIIAGQTHLTRLAVDTQLRSHNKTAVLKLDSTVSLGGAQFAEARLSLTGPDGESVPLPKSVIKYSGAGDVKSDITVQHPKLWNAETPNLYTLRVELVADGEVVEAVTRRVGFREIEIENFFTKELRVNGQPVFLRGVDWTNLNPTGGLAFDYESDRKSLLLLKKANVNMIRTSHHPQYEAILELCDELGIYVESEAGPHLVTDGHVHEWIEKYHTLNDKKYAAWFLTQYAENVERARSHASVIIYSLGNESSFGKNQERGALYTRAIDPSRPIKFSWWGEYVQSCLTDFRSVHYDDPPLVPQKVAVVDEYAHLHTGGRRIESDPGLRGYYAHVIAAKADLLWKHYSTAGGAIWHSRDFLVFGPGGVMPFNPEWGLLDPWNRPKPEYYDVKKAYSPIKVDERQTLTAPSRGRLSLEVENRYAFTSLDEILCRWSVGDESGAFALPNIKPGCKGTFTLPERAWKNGEILTISFVRPQHEPEPEYVIDTVRFTLGGERAPEYPQPQGPAPAVSDGGASVTVAGQDFSIVFSKETGKITSGEFRRQALLCSGPDLNLGVDLTPSGWTLNGITAETAGPEAVVTVDGAYANAGGVTFTLRIDGTGRIETAYDFVRPAGSVNEIGVAFTLVGADRIRWSRKPNLWSWYPEESVGRLSGTAYRLRPGSQPEAYGQKPTWDWKDTTHQYRGGIDGDYKATYDFRAAKWNVYTCDLLLGNNIGLRAELSGAESVRASVNPDETVVLRANSHWGSPPPAGWEETLLFDQPLAVAAGQRVSGRLVFRMISGE